MLDKMRSIRNEIFNFTQKDFEPLYEAWERFKDLLRSCPHHGLSIGVQIQTFYCGVTNATRNKIDVAAGGTIMDKTPHEVYEIIEEMTSIFYQWATEMHQPIFTTSSCDFCGGGHPNRECQSGFDVEEWLRHVQGHSYVSSFQEEKPNLEDTVAKFEMSTESSIQNIIISTKNFETHLNHIATALSNETQGSLPISTEENAKEQVQEMVPRIGKEFEEPMSIEHDERVEEEVPILVDEQMDSEIEEHKEDNGLSRQKEEKIANFNNLEPTDFSKLESLPLQSKYVILDDNDEFLMIFCSSSTGLEKGQLLEARRKPKIKRRWMRELHKRIGYSCACHKFFMREVITHDPFPTIAPND